MGGIKANFMRGVAALPTPIGNVFIGGVGSVITSANEMASYLDVTVAAIQDFAVDLNNNISFTLSQTATINAPLPKEIITHYIDIEGVIIGPSSLQFQPLRFVYTPVDFNITPRFIGDRRANGIYTNLVVSLPNTTQFGTTVGETDIFETLTVNPVLKVFAKSTHATSNAGNPDGDLQGAIDNGAEVLYSSNSTNPDAVQSVTINDVGGTFIEMGLTVPSSTNAIDSYVLFVDGSINAIADDPNKAVVYDLDPNTSYEITILAIDAHGNLSPFSPIFTLSTTGFKVYQPDAFYKLSTDSLDSVGTLNGTDTGVVYDNDGVINGCANFAAAAATVNFGDDPVFSVFDGTADGDWSLSVFFKFDSTGLQFPMTNAVSSSSGREWYLRQLNGLIFYIRDEVNNVWLQITTGISPPTNAWTHLLFGYNKALGKSAIYMNKVLIGEATPINGYVKSNDFAGNTLMGRLNGLNSQYYTGKACEMMPLKGVAPSQENAIEIYEKAITGGLSAID